MELPFIAVAILCFLAVVCFLIVLHELGHYWAARMFGLKPQAFSVGLGPELAGYTDRHGTRWKIAPIPLGGYVKFHGEMHPGTGTDEERDHKESFARLARWKRAVVIFAGPFVNIVVCAAIFIGIYAFIGVPVSSDRIIEVTPNGTAAAAGIRPGDRLVTWNGNEFDGSQDFFRHLKIHPDRSIDVVVDRSGQQVSATVPIARVPIEDRFGNKAEVGRIGVTFDQEVRRITDPAGITGSAVWEAINLFTLQGRTLWQMVTGERSLDEISGPVRLAKFSGEQYMLGWLPLAYFAAVLSCAIAFMNLLPVPGLDGGYLALYAVEGLRRRDLSKKAFTNAVKVGYGLVGILMVFGLTNDLRVLLW